MSSSEVIQFLKNSVPLFLGFTDEKLKELVKGSRLTTFEPNEAIIEFGEEGRFMGVLLEGEAAVSTMNDEGEQERLDVLKAGDPFGEMSLMTGDRTTANVIGLTRCRALIIPQALFSSILITQPSAIKQLSRLISDRSRKLAVGDGNRQRTSCPLQQSADPYGLRLKTDDLMRILVLNCGSSSLKYNLFDTGDENRHVRGTVERIGADSMRHTWKSAQGDGAKDLPAGTHRDAFAAMVEVLTAPAIGNLRSLREVTAIGHRVVHGGDRFSTAVVLTDEILKEIEGLSDLAPLHNPVNLSGIREAKKLFPKAPHVAVFDTAFHHTLPPYASLYGLPYEYYEKHRIRRYGFHGMSHAYVAFRAAERLKRSCNELEIITCHLGNGASICAVDHGRSVDTSMGFTPSEGLIMGTRCGDLDPSILIHLLRTQKMSWQEMEDLVNRQSGLKGLSKLSNDMREVEKAAHEGNHHALLAFKTFCYRIRKYIGAYVAAMGGVDALVFTGGIGQGSAGVRSLACQGLGYMGIHLDEEENRAACDGNKIRCISSNNAPVAVFVIPTDEELMIARETLRAINRQRISHVLHAQAEVPIPIEVSAHHVHLSTEHVAALFGAGHELTNEFELSQPGQYACKEKVNLIGPKGRVDRVRVLGPARKETQVEIAMTEQFKLGVQPPVRESGDVEDTPGITLEGSAGRVTTAKGVICAMRHVHLSPEDALRFGLRDRSVVRVRVKSDRELVFGDVLVRVHPSFRLAMHIDTDEANAAKIETGMTGSIIGVHEQA